MKRFLAVLALCAFLQAHAGESYLGTITGSATKNNADTAAPFGIPASAKVSIQCDAAVYVGVGNSPTLTVTSANGVQVAANALFLTSTPSNCGPSGCYIAVLPVSGTATCRVFGRSGTEG